MAKIKSTNSAKSVNNTNSTENNRARIGYLSYEDMLVRLGEGKIDEYDIIICYDKNTIYVISPELKPIEMKSRVYLYNSIEEANSTLNKNIDTYEGQIVSILTDGKYKGYIVNKDAGIYYVSPIHEAHIVDYNSIGNRPITNLVGTLENPIEIVSLKSGIYNVTGQYKILNTDNTTYLSANQILFIVDKEGEVVKTKKITSNEIVDYVVKNGEVVSDKIVTETFLKENGYCTEEYINVKLEALDVITKTEVEAYVDEVVTKIISDVLDNMLDEKIDDVLNERIQEVDETEIVSLF